MKRKKVNKTKSFIESKMLNLDGNRTHVLRVNVVIQQKLYHRFNNIDVTLTEMPLN